ncbi:MAG: MBL fold metallo-hydrolase [Chloroflexi bacterium]|nr:MBL fold metallo-hydrolase [Chloroflexota bacterium]
MPLEIVKFTLGPAMTNAYIVADNDSNECVVIDPAWDGHLILAEAEKRGWRISNIWLTHAHFDHVGGAAAVADGSNPPPPVALHPDDYWLWREKGGASAFGLEFDPGPEPSVDLEHDQKLFLGNFELQVRHAPGHTPGHVMFYCQSENLLFCGDVIFQFSIGRTDFPRGSHETLIESIQTQVLTLPDETILLPGHGAETKVGVERQYNPFLQ